MDTKIRSTWSMSNSAHKATLGPKNCTVSGLKLRKILVSVKFVSAILWPEMAAPIFMDTCKKCVLSAGKTMSVKFRFFGGGVFGGGGGECRFYFYGRADFSEKRQVDKWHLFRMPTERGGISFLLGNNDPEKSLGP